jgi:hypothetical protein
MALPKSPNPTNGRDCVKTLIAVSLFVGVSSCDFVDRLVRSEKSDPRNYTKSHQPKSNGNPSFDTVSAVGGWFKSALFMLYQEKNKLLGREQQVTLKRNEQFGLERTTNCVKTRCTRESFIDVSSCDFVDRTIP